ncbi:unnamed protein product [Tilletia caries]|nr:hypothetical protein CF336_g6945 [Tilletia laevis]KAE8189105.1 hypothetical protein CF328_g6384 [Tilletia controversa]CAD6887011.1 unnamed protein product [Tilletia caries]CAD6901403.1 unnamed protein product [Tilletia caries]CAD6911771.1 unnamed protein product [Tilletia controversa]
MAKADAGSEMSNALAPYAGQEQDALLRARLLTEDRQFRRISRKIIYLSAPELKDPSNDDTRSSSPENLGPKLAAALTSVHLELSTFAHTAKRQAFLASTSLPAQRRAYESQSAALDAQIAQRQTAIAQLRAELDFVKRERQNKLVYDDIARRINLLPTRAQLNDRLERLHRELASLRNEVQAYDELDETARARFRLEICEKLEGLQRDLGDEVGRRERSAVERAQERGEDVDAEVAALEAETDAAAAAAHADGEGEEREPGEVEEGEADTASGSPSHKRSRRTAGTAVKPSLRTSAAESTPLSQKRLIGSIRGDITPSRMSSPAPVAVAAAVVAASSTPSGSRKRARTEDEDDEDIILIQQDKGSTSSGTIKASSTSVQVKGSAAVKGKGKANNPIVITIEDDTASSLTSLEEGEHSDMEVVEVQMADAKGGNPSRDEAAEAHGAEIEGEEADDDADADAEGEVPSSSSNKRATGRTSKRRASGSGSTSKSRRRSTTKEKDASISTAAAGESTPTATTGGRKGRGSKAGGSGSGAGEASSPTTASAPPLRKRRRA